MAIPTTTIGDLVESVSFALTNNRTPSTDLGAEIKKAIGRIVNAMVLETNHPAFIKETTLALSNGSADYDLPDDFASMIEPGMYFDTGAKETLHYYDEQDRVRMEMPRWLNDTAKPYHYTIRNRDSGDGLWQARFLPTPDASYTVRYSYFSTPEYVDDNTADTTDLDMRFPRGFTQGLVYGAAMEFPQYLGTDQRQDYAALYLKATRGMQNNKKPVVGTHHQQRKYQTSRKPGQNAWRTDIYNGNPLR